MITIFSVDKLKKKTTTKVKKKRSVPNVFHNKRVQKAYPVTRLFFFLFVNSLNIS